MTITALPTPPSRSDTPAAFITLADAFLAALPTFATEANALAVAMNLNATTDTSASSVAIGTGAKSFTVTAGKSFVGGMWLVIADTAAPSTNSMVGQVTSYSGTALVMNITAVIGSGTKTAWTISQSAQGGAAMGANADITSLSACTIISALLSTPFAPATNDFRLTLTSGLPVTTADVSGATTIYCTPYKGKSIALYDGSTRWNIRQSAEFSLALGTLVSGKAYDVFAYDNAGVPTLEFLVWTNDTTRATALTYQDGVLVKTGATTRRYLGTFYTTSTTQTEDSLTKRYLWNYYHRIARPMVRKESTASWTYSLAAFQQANASASNQLNYVQGVAEDEVTATATALCTNSTATIRPVSVGIGVDSATVTSSLNPYGYCTNATGVSMAAQYRGIPGVGRHYLAWLEYGAGADTQTFYGNGTPQQTGIIGSIPA